MIDALLRWGPAPGFRVDFVRHFGEPIVMWLEREAALVASRSATEVPCPEADPTCAPHLSPRRGDEHVVVCGRRSDRCAPTTVAAARLVRRKLDPIRFAELLARALGASGLDVHPMAKDVTRLGLPAHEGRDTHVVWGALASEGAHTAFAQGPALVLVGDLAVAKALRRDGVETRLASTVVELRPDGLRALPRKKSRKAPAKRQDPPRDLDLPRPERWEELHFVLVDGHAVRIRVGNEQARRSFVDLGMRSQKNLAPDQAWQTLAVLCRGDGDVHWRDVGHTAATCRQRVSRLRIRLKAVFGLDTDPFARVLGRVKARFGARKG